MSPRSWLRPRNYPTVGCLCIALGSLSCSSETTPPGAEAYAPIPTRTTSSAAVADALLSLTISETSGGWRRLAAATDGAVGGPKTDKPTSTGSESLTYDLAGPMTVTRARINEDNAGNWNIETWKLQYWDGAAWIDAFAESPTPAAGWHEIDFPDVVTERVRFILNDPSHPEVRELEVYGHPSGPCVPQLSQFPGASISPLNCSLVKVEAPWNVDFTSSTSNSVDDGTGTGTGFTMILPSTSGSGYQPQNLSVDVASGELSVTTTAGIKYGSANSQDNALGVGIDLPNASFRMETSLANPPSGSGQFEQAGLWFGISERDYVKLVVMSTSGGPRIQALLESADGTANQFNQAVSLPADEIRLALELDPDVNAIRALVRVGSAGSEFQLGQFSGVDSAWFSKDAAGIDFDVGTRSFGGIFATHRNRSPSLGPLTYRFKDFGLSVINTGPAVIPPGQVDFRGWNFNSFRPTALVYGPDERLYVATVTGDIRVFRIDHAAQTATLDETITGVQNRLLLGLAIDPDSTPTSVTLWAGHSDVSQGNGAANSGEVTRMTSPNWTPVDVITGLPRAIANHSTNEIGFGPDGRLYIAQGGNTGGGASNDGNSEFGPRPEQPLSAAILVADVKAPGFDGTCTPLNDPNGTTMDATGVASRSVPCDVEVYSSGLRNTFDFVFHSNGRAYATDNGLGVEGTFPILSPTPLTWNPATGCEGPVNGAAARSANNPGTRPDLLYDLVDGGYYGHPNPSRDECVFQAANPTSGQDGPVPATGGGISHLETTKYPVGLGPEPSYVTPMFSFGNNKSANGIIEYRAHAFCDELRGDLLVTYYSQQDQIRRLTLSADGSAVSADATLTGSNGASGGQNLSNPLTLAADPLGRIYISEFGANRVRVLDPIGPGCWQTDDVAPLPTSLLDGSGAVVNNELYVVAGKTAAGPQRALYVYDPSTDAWRVGPPLPFAYPSVENAGAAVHDGQLYVMGGSTAPFSGAVSAAARFDPSTQAWTLLTSMPAARGGVTARAIQGKIYLAGGMDGSGQSQSSLLVYDPQTDAWSTGPSMSTPRDNPMTAVVDGRLFVFGGRTRSVPGLADDGALTSAEVYDPTTNTWAALADMPTGRRTGNATAVRGRVVVFGGEGNGTFPENQLYDPASDTWSTLESMPVARHGAVAGRLGNGIYVVGGGPTQGSSFTSDVDVFHFD